MQRRSIDDLKTHLDEWLQVHRIPAAKIRGYVTPRRLALIADGIPSRQPDHDEEKRGPRIGSPEQAISGFLRSVGLVSIDQCEVREDRYFAVIKRPGHPSIEVLPDLIYSTLMDVAWPKTMRFPASPLRWVRPLSSVICLFDGAIVKIPLGEVPVGRMTRGHRFLALDPIEVANGPDYLGKLGRAYVMLDSERRRKEIEDGLEKAASLTGVRFKSDPGLLDEVTGLVEWPSVLSGQIDPEFMALPAEVLATAMRTHQKYFSCLNPDGSLAPRFLFVANNLTPDDGKTIVPGNERVLKARLADARFFWDQDRKVRLEDRVEALKDRVYHAKLGSVFDKMERMKTIAFQLASFLQVHTLLAKQPRRSATADAGIDPMWATKLAEHAAYLCKADLSTGMVGEFPELQGAMGRYYALHDGEAPRVADAIADHYKPLGPNDSCPTAPVSIVVALADKFETLVGFFAINEKPTGSRDPFALRRAALGIIRLILENDLRLGLRDAIDYASSAFKETNYGLRDVKPELLPFIADRLKVHLREQGVRHDLIAAAFVQTTGIPEVRHVEDDLVRLIARVRALESFLATDDGSNLLIAYRRAANIVAIEEKRDSRRYDDQAPDLTPGMLRLPEEIALDTGLRAVNTAPEIWSEDFSAAMARLATLRQPIDAFFDKVTVNTDDPKLRENRLRLLSAIRATMNRVADFSQIEG